MPRLPYILTLTAGVLLTLLPLGPVLFPWVAPWKWLLAGAWWFGTLVIIGAIERRKG